MHRHVFAMIKSHGSL